MKNHSLCVEVFIVISNQFLYKKDINKSVLCDGFGIDREYVNLFTNQVGVLQRGEKRKISLILNDNSYSAILTNIRDCSH